MSRGFIKEEDQEEIPMVAPRAILPPGVSNYVTPNGMNELLAEKEMLLGEKENLHSENENEQRIANNHINAKLHLLNKRIAEAKVIQLHEQNQNEIRFGAKVKLKNLSDNQIQQFQIVGVDEAKADKGKSKISFVSPLAKALINKKIGEQAILVLPSETRKFEILDISYK